MSAQRVLAATWWSEARVVACGPGSRSPGRETLETLRHLSDEELGVQFGVCPRTAQRWRYAAGVSKARGIPPRLSLLVTESSRVILCRWRGEGLTVEEMAQRSGLATWEVKELRERLGLIRHRRRPRVVGSR